MQVPIQHESTGGTALPTQRIDKILKSYRIDSLDGWIKNEATFGRMIQKTINGTKWVAHINARWVLELGHQQEDDKINNIAELPSNLISAFFTRLYPLAKSETTKTRWIFLARSSGKINDDSVAVAGLFSTQWFTIGCVSESDEFLERKTCMYEMDSIWKKHNSIFDDLQKVGWRPPNWLEKKPC